MCTYESVQNAMIFLQEQGPSSLTFGEDTNKIKDLLHHVGDQLVEEMVVDLLKVDDGIKFIIEQTKIFPEPFAEVL